MSDGITSWGFSTFLAQRALYAQAVGQPQPQPPASVALPGAKVAIAHDRLLAHQESGRPEVEIVGRVNARWARENADRLEAHARWSQGPYAEAIEGMRRAQAEDAARELRRQAALERMAEERLEEEGG